MKTVGSILRQTRTAKGLMLDQVERDTKIRAKFLEGIEEDDYSKLPSQSYAKGFIKNYGVYLGLNADTLLAFFRRQTHDVPRSSLLPKGVSAPLDQPLFRLTPGNFLAFLLAGLAAVFLAYFGLQYRNLQLPPSLTIDSPKEKLITTEKRIDVLGKTDPDATVTINGVSVIVRSDGRFFDQVTLVAGINKITIAVTSRYGKSFTLIREVAQQTTQ
ncbi:helix-turn-helix domain-containing protein [Candidatus Gottesmanbacteria bacterium]|nr:helix-turn-helix domain-containing protein [Candidatus Gottesmanbacteria bacterium]